VHELLLVFQTKFFRIPYLLNRAFLTFFLPLFHRSLQDWVWEPRAHDVLSRFRSTLLQQAAQGSSPSFVPSLSSSFLPSTLCSFYTTSFLVSFSRHSFSPILPSLPPSFTLSPFIPDEEERMANRFAQHMCVTRKETTTAEASAADVLLKVGRGGREGGREGGG